MKAYQHLLNLFSEHLARFTDGIQKQEPPELYQPSAYIISLGGKRLRPLLALIACDLFGKDSKAALDSALAVELFHNFSLIHDDILDEAPLRRNQPTVHQKWNRNIAILSGDALLVQSLQALQNYPSEEMKQLSVLLSETAMQVCEGQQMDMNFETAEKISIPDYIRMIRFKTAVLLGCSLKMGAINAYAPFHQQQLVFEFGLNLGIAFQLMDDLLDAFASEPEKFGKQVGGDILSNKKTFLLLKALELADKDQSAEISDILKMSPGQAEHKVKRMLDVYEKLRVNELCRQEADHYTSLALDALNRIEADKGKKEELTRFSKELLNRQV